jgi:glycyl-tRNA synthetase beta chain
MPELLLELFSEEIPARMQARAAEDLRRLVTDGLVERGLTYGQSGVFATPRRLALVLTDVSPRSRETREERKGPRTDAPEKAVEGFLRSTGLTREQLEIRADKKTEVYFAVTTRPGRDAARIIAETVTEVVRNFPWPKSMRWGEGSLRWVRPLHSILCALSTEEETGVVPVDIPGVPCGQVTRGHRFMSPAPLVVRNFEDYATKLRHAHVLIDPAERAEKISHDADQLAFARGLEVVEDPALLHEIAGLVEWPVVLMGLIEERFLELPPEVLQTSMKEHQKFLSVRNRKTNRIEGYVVVANRETADEGATILAGNARVLAARLSDAAFFWENDLATPLEAMAAKLASVTFHNRLGTQADRIDRIANLARDIAPRTGADLDLAERAARLAKADLASAMVYEFPELQGVMGRYYAARAGEDAGVAAAAAEHYSPLGPADTIPDGIVAITVALADKIDTLTCFWAIDEKPTGSKDPFALRRAALGVIRILLEAKLRLSPREVFHAHAAVVQRSVEAIALQLALDHEDGAPETAPVGARSGSVSDMADDLLAFMHERLKVYLRDQNLRHDVFDACLAMPGADDLALLVTRARTLQDFLGTDDGANLLQGFKRANNILTAEERKDGVEYSLDPDARLAETDAERGLFSALDVAEAAIGSSLASEDFDGAMSALAALRGPIDGFFDSTVVNADSPIVRRNRLCLLHRIRRVMDKVAIFAAIEGA